MNKVEECIDLYIANRPSLCLPIDRQYCISSFVSYVANGAFFDMVEEEGKVVAWILCAVFPIDTSRQKCLRQVFYASSLTGVKAVRAVRELHRKAVQFAKRRRVPIVVSMGSYEDSSNTFTRILKKDGWEVEGYLAVFYPNRGEVPAEAPR